MGTVHHPRHLTEHNGVRANGVVVFLLMGCLWSLAFAGFGYAIALKTGDPAAVNSSFLLFFPFLFMTSSYGPAARSAAGWA
jgi:ABC-2 type transport system permease protein